MNVNARDFADQWIAAWNAHDVEAVLSHYAEDIVFLTPVAQRRLGNGRVEGIAALRAYWEPALASLPDLHFEFEAVLDGHNCLTILYRNQLGRVAETVAFNAAGKVVRSFACYG